MSAGQGSGHGIVVLCKVLTRGGLSSEGPAEEGSTSTLTWLLAAPSFLLGIGQRASICCWLPASGHPQLLATCASPTWLLASSEPTRERQNRHHNLPSPDHGVTSQHLCHIILVNLVMGSSPSRRGNCTWTRIAADGLMGVPWVSMCHTTSGRGVAANTHASQAGGREQTCQVQLLTGDIT